jgi:two-component system NtrC family sensor kinase
VEREVGPAGVAALLRAAGRPREYLIAEYNSIPLAVADELARLSMRLMGEPDEDRWARRYAEDFMDWKPSREERSWGGAYTIGLGSPRAAFAAIPEISSMSTELGRAELVELGRSRAVVRYTPGPGVRLPRWVCTWQRVCYERYPTNWRLPRARIVERQCAARGADACLYELRWKNASLGRPFWIPAFAGLAGAGLTAGVGALAAVAAPAAVLAPVPAVLGVATGYALLQRRRRGDIERLNRIRGDEILHSSRVLERKFRDLETKVGELSLLADLSRAVNSTLDPEKIYDHALRGLVEAMGYQGAYLYLVDHARGVVRGHRMAGAGARERFEGLEFRLDDPVSGGARVARTGEPLVVPDAEAGDSLVHLPTARSLEARSIVMVPLRVKDRMFGVLVVAARQPNRFGPADVEPLAAVANHVALAVDRAESFQTIEDLSRGLEEKVRVRTEQLQAANEELRAAYRDLQQAQMQLVQREKMASVGQLVAGVAHELNNPIGFVSSNVATLGDFVGRLRTMLEAYRARAGALPPEERQALQSEWDALKLDYALKYLDSMIEGIGEGADRTRKIVRDLRVFARSDDQEWQAVDVHEELESSLTLLNHLLKDRVTVHRKFGTVPSVECLRSQIDQVFLNLLANAAQAIAGPGEITIETGTADGVAVVVIRDTGPGIPPEVMGRIFDPFFTTKPVGEGTGLGLSISYQIVKRHGGDLVAESRPGEGATFTVRLPLRRAG